MTRKLRFKVDKLIRDKMPEVMHSYGIALYERVMGEDEYMKRLRDKILEEAKEVCAAKNQAEIKEDLADLLEVIHALALAEGLSYEEIEEERLKKKHEKGSFFGRIYSAFSEMDANHQYISYYLSEPERYPEMK